MATSSAFNANNTRVVKDEGYRLAMMRCSHFDLFTVITRGFVLLIKVNALGRYILIRYFAVRDADGTYRGVVEMSQDITDIQTLEGDSDCLIGSREMPNSCLPVKFPAKVSLQSSSG